MSEPIRIQYTLIVHAGSDIKVSKIFVAISIDFFNMRKLQSR